MTFNAHLFQYNVDILNGSSLLLLLFEIVIDLRIYYGRYSRGQRKWTRSKHIYCKNKIRRREISL